MKTSLGKKLSKTGLIFALSFLFSISASAQNKSGIIPQTMPADFKSDGCSHFPDGDYLDCCYEHDKAYYFGGNWKERWHADKKLYQCVAAKKGFDHKLIAPLMWAGVRVFGVPFLPTSFRWGFGRKKGIRDKGLDPGQTQSSNLPFSKP